MALASVVLTYLRSRLEPDVLHRFAPKPADHPSVGRPCPLCGAAFAAGDATTLVPLGPGDDEEERERCRAGRYYNAVAVEAHWSCATGRP